MQKLDISRTVDLSRVLPNTLTRSRDFVEARKNYLIGSIVAASLMVAPLAANAQGTGTGGTQTYGLGQAGSPAATDYFAAAQGFNSSLAPLLTAILPVLVVILAIWQGPKLLKRLTTMMAH